MTLKLLEIYQKWGLERNINKTQYFMYLGRRRDVPILNDGRCIQYNETDNYFGL